jgi:uncharacterized membrane protein
MVNIGRIAPVAERKAFAGSEGALNIWSSVLNILGLLVVLVGVGLFLMETNPGSAMLLVWCLAAGISCLITGAVLRALAEIVVSVRTR